MGSNEDLILGSGFLAKIRAISLGFGPFFFRIGQTSAITIDHFRKTHNPVWKHIKLPGRATSNGGCRREEKVVSIGHFSPCFYHQLMKFFLFVKLKIKEK